MAEGVVHDLEAIEIDEEDAEPPLMPALASHGAREQLTEERPVRQARHLVVRCQVLDPRLRFAPLGDVLDDRDVVDTAAVR